MNRLYNVISSYEVIGFLSVFRRINEGNSIFIIYGTSLVRGNKILDLTSRLSEVGVANLGKFLQGIFRIIAVKYPDDWKEESATWSTDRREGEVEFLRYSDIGEAVQSV